MPIDPDSYVITNSWKVGHGGIIDPTAPPLPQYHSNVAVPEAGVRVRAPRCLAPPRRDDGIFCAASKRRFRVLSVRARVVVRQIVVNIDGNLSLAVHGQQRRGVADTRGRRHSAVATESRRELSRQRLPRAQHGIRADSCVEKLAAEF